MGRDPIRAVLGVDCFYIIVMQQNVFGKFHFSERSHINTQLVIFNHVTVHTEDSDISAIIEDCCCIDIGYAPVIRTIVNR